MSAAVQIEDDHTIDPAMLHQILEPYQGTDTAYLKTASVVGDISDDDEMFSISGAYSIPSSCYIDSTGHFNAVEFIICYNQIAYVAFGHLIANGLLPDLRVRPATDEACALLSDMTYDMYLSRQLSAMFIVKSDIGFSAPIDPQRFYGKFDITKLLFRKGTFFIKTRCTFSDDAGKGAAGEVVLAYPVKAIDTAAQAQTTQESS